MNQYGRRQIEVQCTHLRGYEGHRKILEEVVKPGAHSHVFSSSLQLALWHNALLPQYAEERTRITSDHKDLGFESTIGEAVQIWAVLAVEKKHYTILVLSVVAKKQCLQSGERLHQSWRWPSTFGDQEKRAVSFLATHITKGTGRYILITLDGPTQ